jgi:hypothetical protein
MKKIVLLAIVTLLGLSSNSQTYEIIRKQTISEYTNSKSDLIKQSLNETINPLSSFKLLPKKYKATITIQNSELIFKDETETKTLTIKNEINGNYICRDTDNNEYQFQITPIMITLSYTGEIKNTDKIESKMIIYTIK